MICYSNSYHFDYFCGWRYLFSPAFRDAMYARWGANRWTRALCFAGVAISLLVTGSAAILAVLAVLHVMNV
jgi:hypothetical protein